MVPTVLVHHGTSLLRAISVGRRFEIVVGSLADHITNAALVTRDFEFGVEKVCG